MKWRYLTLFAVMVFLLCGCKSTGNSSGNPVADTPATLAVKALPVTGTFINLPYQDVRNKYTNPPHIDNTDPQMWATKIAEMKKMGMEYLVFMSVANEQKAYYPSKLMEWHYPQWRQSPVDAIMEAAERSRNQCGRTVVGAVFPSE